MVTINIIAGLATTMLIMGILYLSCDIASGTGFIMKSYMLSHFIWQTEDALEIIGAWFYRVLAITGVIVATTMLLTKYI